MRSDDLTPREDEVPSSSGVSRGNRPVMKNTWFGLPCVAFMLLLSACAATVTSVAPSANPETSYRLITPKDAPHYTLEPGQSAAEPKPLIGYFVPPRYPPSLARPDMPVVQVKAQLVFDEVGHVRETLILSNSYSGAGGELFDDAVREATAQWAFTPLVFEQTVGGGSGVPVTLKREAKPFSLWFEFDFRMVGGKPTVSTTRDE